MSFHEQTTESDSLAVLDTSIPSAPLYVEIPVAQVLPECALDWDWLLGHQ